MAKTILLVDDEKSIRDSLNKLLHTEGYEVVLAGNGQEAIQMLVREPIDILILDIGLPVKDGWATLRWLNQVNPLFPVILITGRWRQAELAEAAGVAVLMEKPLNITLLLQHIRELLLEPAKGFTSKRPFRSVSCDIEKFCDQMFKRLTTPYPFRRPRHPKSL